MVKGFAGRNHPQITQITQKRKLKELSHKKAQEAQNEIETSSQGFIQDDPESEISFCAFCAFSWLILFLNLRNLWI